MEGSSNQLKKDKIVFLILFILMIVCFFFPFKIIETPEGFHSTIFGNSNYVPYSLKALSGFQFPLSYFVFLFVPLSALLILFSSKKAGKIIGLIVSILHLFFMLFLFFALRFHLNFFGPKIIVKAGIGYYFLLGLSVLFLIQIILSFRTSLLMKEKTFTSEDLLDDFK